MNVEGLNLMPIAPEAEILQYIQSCLSGKIRGVRGYSEHSPNVSDTEAKAAILSRFLELRWSSDAAPPPCSGTRPAVAGS
ncbi:hypothetical protein IQ269_26280 [Tychonema sp. LEGE 07199]|uniref:hypothetical protein n=1 Tax=unclassified Tychonema TaxID=2642144 RepID=UPI001880E137|nr:MULTISPECIES: hypothetical protein [unclassified Tychonema]MBE9124212.1 hypothetical protein [Tychonema sp. LEGE 07199]MBE9135372.1 hypothetical protein [Tychonema sp. LEGE 07196]